MILASGFFSRQDTKVDKAALSESAQARMTQMLEEVLEPAMKAQAQRNPDDFVYVAPEVWRDQVMSVGARIVNRALTIAFEEWSKKADSCAYCLEYEHGMKPANAVTCTCLYHCGATVCPEEPLRACSHPTYGDTSHCADIACENYAGKHVRTVNHKGRKPTREDIQSDNAVKHQPGYIDRVLGN